MKLIACDPLIGRPRVPAPGIESSLDDFLGEMQRLQLSAAVVRHRVCTDISPIHGNRVLMQELAGREGLFPAWGLTPDGQTPDFDIEATVRAMLGSGVKVAWIDPTAHEFSPQPWCSGAMYDILQQARVPLLADYSVLGPDAVHTISKEFPQLRLALLGVPRVGRNRMVYPLLRMHPNLHVCFTPTFSVFDGHRDLCDTFGPDRWLLGTGYPNAEGGSGITGLMYSGLQGEAVEAIAYGNIERLLAEVRHDI